MASLDLVFPESAASQSAPPPVQGRRPASMPFPTTLQLETTSNSSNEKADSKKRKRTKTGCLTCRARRIKCDESHPICHNCLRSRRVCEGYKNAPKCRHPIAIPYGFNVDYNVPNEDVQHFHHTGFRFVPPLYEQGSPPPSQPFTFLPGVASMPIPHGHGYNAGGVMLPGSSGHCPQGGVQFHSSGPRVIPDVTPVAPILSSNNYTTDLLYQGLFSFNDHDVAPRLQNPFHAFTDTSALMTSISSLSPTLQHGQYELEALIDNHSRTLHAQGVALNLGNIQTPGLQNNLVNWSVLPTTNEVDLGLGEGYSYSASPDNSGGDYVRLEVLGETELFYEKDGVYVEEEKPLKHDFTNTVGNDGDTLFTPPMQRTRYPTCAEDKMAQSHLELDHFQPVAENPLDSALVKSIFQHFVTTSGPLITAFDRSSPLDQPMLDQTGMPYAYPGLFTSTLPMLALQNQGLLHAMLALASLDIAKATGASTTPSLKHYLYSLRRVHGAVRTDKHRHAVTTLGSTLLLAFYEVVTADHSKWNTHLSGAAQLVREINFAEMTRQLRLMMNRRLHFESADGQVMHHSNVDHYHVRDPLLDHFTDLDPGIIGVLTGREVNFDQNGKVIKDRPASGSGPRPFSRTELQDYEVLRDLYWWYVRQDAIHAMTSGSDLLLEYDDWIDCPPRAPIGQLLAHYGSQDHLWLLIGRVLRFIYKDRKRKIAVAKKAQSSQSSNAVPPAASIDPSSTQTQTPRTTRRAGTTSTNNSTAAPPKFYGMAPLSSPPMPQVFRSPNSDPTNTLSKTFNPTSLESATAAAWSEYNSILTAFTTFSHALGPSYQPLDPSVHPPSITPFGPSLHYRTPGIACLWAWYYTGLILLTRGSPSMPPHTTISVGAAAPQTAPFATIIGRIVAGMPSPSSITAQRLPRAPSLAGAVTDPAIALFFAAVQFRGAEERAWTIGWMKEAEALGGWASIGLCANGCESAWVKAWELGRGEAYVRVMGFEVEQQQQHPGDERVSSGVVAAASAVRSVDGARHGVAAMTATTTTVPLRAPPTEQQQEQEQGTSGIPDAFDATAAQSSTTPHGFMPLRRGGQVVYSYSLYTKLEEGVRGLSLK